jgi:hypothetical protein
MRPAADVTYRTSLALFALGLSYPPQRALACPDCSVSRVVRASVFDGGFTEHLLLIALPLLVLSVICALLYRIGRPVASAQRARVIHSQEDFRS